MASEDEETRQHRLAQFEPREDWTARGSGGEAIRAGKNTKVTVLAERIIERFLEQGLVELETVGAGAVNQALKACPEQGRRAVARARRLWSPRATPWRCPESVEG